MNADLPLVSIIVITYNSSKFVLETLESAKAQTYENIELIISDDGSQDQTIELCDRWLADNKERFINSQIITVEKNTGIPANCNRGVKAAKGEWIKLIAGDDILLEDCVITNVKFCSSSAFKICFSNIVYFNEHTDFAQYPYQDEKYFIAFTEKSVDEKLDMYCRYPLFLNTPSWFFSRQLYDINRGFDETIPLLEDQPFIVRTLSNNVDIGFIKEYTVKYRKEAMSTVGNQYFNDNLQMSFIKYRKHYLQKTFLNRFIIVLEQTKFFYLQKNKKRSIIYKAVNRLYYYLVKKYINV